MLKDSQHIGHSSPSSLLTVEEASSSDNSLPPCFSFLNPFLNLRAPVPARHLDAKFHILWVLGVKICSNPGNTSD